MLRFLFASLFASIVSFPFQVTCGEDSPLTASALRGLGEALKRRSDMERHVNVNYNHFGLRRFFALS